MPTRPPNLKPSRPTGARKLSNWNRRESRQARGYGREHDLMRKRVLIEEPLCRLCTERGVITPTTIADHIVAKAEGGSDERGNYQGLCGPCSATKTAQESKRVRARRP